MDPVVFTDLDGTVLDEAYRPGPAAGAIGDLLEAGVGVVPCSSKTRAEQEAVAEQLGLAGAPLVVENGGALIMADGGPLAVDGSPPVVRFGVAYDELRRALRRSAEAVGVTVRGWGDMSTGEVADRTGLAVPAARRARRREHSEPFLVEDAAGTQVDDLLERLATAGLATTVGPDFLTVTGDHSKATGVHGLLDRLGDVGARPATYAVGDHANDRRMLQAVDVGMLVQRPGGQWFDPDLAGVVNLPGGGPEGFRLAAERILDDLDRPR